MKVAILFDYLGPYHHARLNAAARHLDVLAVEFGGASKEYAWERPSADQSLRHETLFPGRGSHEVGYREFSSALSQCLDAFRPDAVAVPGWSGRGAFAALAWCCRARVPAVVMSESTAHDEKRTAWAEAVKRRYVRLCTSALVGGSAHADYLRQLGMRAPRISLGYDAVDNDYFSKAAEREREAIAGGALTVEVQDLEAGAVQRVAGPYFLASARFIAKKNLDRLMQAYAEYRQASQSSVGQTQAWPLVILGDGPLKAELIARRAALGLRDSVLMPGFKQYNQLPSFYARAGAFVHASTVEQWGLVVNEAMASGLPVLVSERCGCAPDLVRHGVNGYRFGPEDVGQIAQTLLRVASMDDASRAAMGRASEEIISQWGPARFGQGLRDAVGHAVQSGPAGSAWLDQLMLKGLSYR